MELKRKNSFPVNRKVRKNRLVSQNSKELDKLIASVDSNNNKSSKSDEGDVIGGAIEGESLSIIREERNNDKNSSKSESKGSLHVDIHLQ